MSTGGRVKLSSYPMSTTFQLWDLGEITKAALAQSSQL